MKMRWSEWISLQSKVGAARIGPWSRRACELMGRVPGRPRPRAKGGIDARFAALTLAHIDCYRLPITQIHLALMTLGKVLSACTHAITHLPGVARARSFC